MMKTNANALMYLAWVTQLLTLLAVVVLSIERVGNVSSDSERHLAASVSTVGVSASLAIVGSVSTGLYYILRGKRSDMTPLSYEPDMRSTSSKYVLLLVGLAVATLQTVVVCFSIASEILLQVHESCDAGSRHGTFQEAVALSVVAFVAHLVTVVVGHGHGFEK